MTALEARNVIATAISTIHRYMPVTSARGRLLGWLQGVDDALAAPATLLSDDDLCDEVTRRPALLTDILDLCDEGAIVAYLAERQARVEVERLEHIHSPHPEAP